jgi:hypothetical protein
MNYINEAAVVVCQLLANNLKSNLEKKKKRRRIWVRKWISYREEKGAATNLCRELEVEDPKEYRNFFRITSEEFSLLLNRVQRRLQKHYDTSPPETYLILQSVVKPSRSIAATIRSSAASLACLFL